MMTVVTQMAVLFIMLVVGYAANRGKVLGPESNRVLTSLVMNITMPCMVLGSVLGSEIQISGGDTLLFMLFVLLSFAAMFLLGLLVPRVLRVSGEDVGVYRFMVMFSNVGFMGYPIAQALYGQEAVFYVSLYNIVFNVLVFSMGVSYISGASGKVNWRQIINPAMVATVAAIVIYALKISLPAVLLLPIQYMGNVTTPVAMLIVGSTLAGMPLKEVFNDWRVYPFAAVSLLVLPVAVWLLFRPFVQDVFMLGVLVLLAAMPGASVSTMLCVQYGRNDRLASKTVFITTLFSVLTVPLLVYLLHI